MRVIVTGGAGKLGQYLVPRLEQDYDVAVFDLAEPEELNVECFVGEATDFDRLIRAFRGADAVVHLAALRSRYNHRPLEVMRTNVQGTFCALQAAADAGARRFVFASSDAVVGLTQRIRHFAPVYLPLDEAHPLQPQDPYGLSKMLGEQMCASFGRAQGLSTVCLRSSNILCPGDEPVYARDARNPEARQKSLWAYVHVSDLVEVYASALDPKSAAEGVFFVAASDPCVLDEDVRQLAARFYPETPPELVRVGPRDALINADAARKALGLRTDDSFEGILREAGCLG